MESIDDKYIKSGEKDNFEYTLYYVNKYNNEYNNEYKCEYKVVSPNENKEFYGVTEKDALKKFYDYVNIQMGLINAELSPLDEAEIRSLEKKIQSNRIWLRNKLTKSHYLCDGDYGLTVREIFDKHDYIAELLHENNNKIEIILKKFNRGIGGYHYILLNKKYETNICELKRIEAELNARK